MVQVHSGRAFTKVNHVAGSVVGDVRPLPYLDSANKSDTSRSLGYSQVRAQSESGGGAGLEEGKEEEGMQRECE